MKNTYRIISLPTLLILVLLAASYIETIHVKAISAQYKPAPYQDAEHGRNSHVYLPQLDISYTDRKNFFERIAPYAQDANREWGIPASAMMGMAAIESGYGTTRIAYYANNIFGIKVWGANPSDAWQLLGQPDEDFMVPIPVLAEYGKDRIIYNETKRRDNWYQIFDSYKEAVNYLAGTKLLNSRYGFARNNYHFRMNQGWSYEEASKQYVYDIANAGYNHLGGMVYREKVGAVMDQWNLYDYDVRNSFNDIFGHWAYHSIESLAKLNIISGFPDGSYRPEASVTREQLVKMLVQVRGDGLILGNVTFKDVSIGRWSNPYIETAVNSHIIMGSNYFEPTKKISRQEMAVFAARTLELQPSMNNLYFKDKNEIDHRSGLIEAAVEHGIIVGFEDNTFRPHNILTRAEASVVMVRILDYIQNKKIN